MRRQGGEAGRRAAALGLTLLKTGAPSPSAPRRGIDTFDLDGNLWILAEGRPRRLGGDDPSRPALVIIQAENGGRVGAARWPAESQAPTAAPAPHRPGAAPRPAPVGTDRA